MLHMFLEHVPTLSEGITLRFLNAKTNSGVYRHMSRPVEGKCKYSVMMYIPSLQTKFK